LEKRYVKRAACLLFSDRPEQFVSVGMAGLMLTFHANLEQLGRANEAAASAVETPGKTPARILELLKCDSNLTVSELAKLIAKSESAVNRAILKLQDDGRLRRSGSRKTGNWEVIP